MKAKKIIISLLNILIILTSLCIIALGAFKLLNLLGINLFKGDIAKILNKLTNTLFNPIYHALAYILSSFKINNNQITQIIAASIPVAVSLILVITCLIVMIKVLKEKGCKASSIINMIISILAIAVVIATIIILLNNKLVKNLNSFLTDGLFTLIFATTCFVSFITSIIACVTSAKQTVTISSQSQPQTQTQTGYANSINTQPQINQDQTQQFAQPQQYTQPQQTAQTSQLTPQQTAAQILFGSNTQTSQTETKPTTPFVSSVPEPTNPFATPTPTNSISNPASAYSQTTSSYTNPSSAYSQNTQTNTSAQPQTTYQSNTTYQTTTNQPFNSANQPSAEAPQTPQSPYQTPINPNQTTGDQNNSNN